MGFQNFQNFQMFLGFLWLVVRKTIYNPKVSMVSAITYLFFVIFLACSNDQIKLNFKGEHD